MIFQTSITKKQQLKQNLELCLKEEKLCQMLFSQIKTKDVNERNKLNLEPITS